jgi:predicted RNase H-like HicB family nuclease
MNQTSYFLCFGLDLAWKEETMRNEFTAIIEKDDEWYIGYCPEIPGANGQGRTVEECRQNLVEAISLILEDRRQDALRGVPGDAIHEVVVLQ